MSLPIKPWAKGSFPEGEGVILEVWLCRAPTGQMFAMHRPQSREDHEMLMSWPSGGLEQAAVGLLTEAVRREAILDILIKETKEPGFIQELTEMEPGDRDAWAQEMAEQLQALLGKTVKDLAPGAFKDALEMMLPRDG